jgi:hypothetical protein
MTLSIEKMDNQQAAVLASEIHKSGLYHVTIQDAGNDGAHVVVLKDYKTGYVLPPIHNRAHWERFRAQMGETPTKAADAFQEAGLALLASVDAQLQTLAKEETDLRQMLADNREKVKEVGRYRATILATVERVAEVVAGGGPEPRSRPPSWKAAGRPALRERGGQGTHRSAYEDALGTTKEQWIVSKLRELRRATVREIAVPLCDTLPAKPGTSPDARLQRTVKDVSGVLSRQRRVDPRVVKVDVGLYEWHDQHPSLDQSPAEAVESQGYNPLTDGPAVNRVTAGWKD